MLLHLPGNHTADTVATAMIEAMRELPEHLRRSITWTAAAKCQWRRIHLQLAAPVILRSALAVAARQQREHQPTAAVLVRRVDLSGHTKADLRRSQDTLNRRPRPTASPTPPRAPRRPIRTSHLTDVAPTD